MKLDLTGQKFGKLEVLREGNKDKKGNRRWLCRCDCGREKEIYQQSLRSGVTQSCGCLCAEQSRQRMSQGWSEIFTEEYLTREHKEKGRSLREIAKEQGCTMGCIMRYVRRFNIEANGPCYNLAGQKIGRLLVIDMAYTKKGGSYWNVECDCGTKKVVKGQCLVRRTTTSCGCWNREKCWQGVGDLGKTYWSRIVKHAARRKLEFSIDMEYAWKLFQEQKGRCALTNESIHLDRSFTQNTHKRGTHVHTASLDRIDSTKGYIPGNVQWVHKTINRMKSNLQEFDFIQWCSKVVAKAC